MPESELPHPDTLEIRELPLPAVRQPDELPSITGGWTDREWTIEGHSFRMTLPAVPDALLDDNEVHEAFDRDEYMPYWAFLWPSALKMVATILRTEWPAGSEVLELGAGIGLVGLAGLCAVSKSPSAITNRKRWNWHSTMLAATGSLKHLEWYSTGVYHLIDNFHSYGVAIYFMKIVTTSRCSN